MVTQHISRLCILLFGSLYPAYSSYKAIKNKDVREYSRWMMYWIVFAIFSFVEIFADIFIGIWLPFYYETKILFVLWLMSPYGNGARILYKHIVHPELNKREHVIDEYITSAKELGISSIWHLYRKISAFLNKLLLQFIQMIHTAMFNQMQRNVYNIQSESSNQIVSQPLLTQPNLFQWMINASSSVVKTKDQRCEQQLNNTNVEFETSADSSIQNPLYQRWFSEEALNIVEIDQNMISNEVINLRLRSESETNLDDWEKMDANENVGQTENDENKQNKSSKQKIKRSRIVKISSTPVRRTTRAAAIKARSKAKVQDLDEDY